MKRNPKKQDVATGAGATGMERFKFFDNPTAELRAIFKDLMELNPQFFEHPVAEIISHAEEKQWFELGESLIELFSTEISIGEREPIYSKFVLNFSKLLNQKHLTNIIILVSKDFSSPSKSLDFIKNNIKYVTDQKYSPLLDLRTVVLMLQNGLFEESLKMLVEISHSINDNSPLPIRSEYWRTKYELDRCSGDFDSLYEDALCYLSTTTPKNYTLYLAFDLCIAALISTNVYSFQELATHPILDMLNNTKSKWLRDLIILLNEGNPEIISEFKHKYIPLLSTNKHLSTHIELIKNKVVMSVFMTLIFNKPFDNRVLTFDEISLQCQIDKNDVEQFALKAFANDLIRGHIDQVEQQIYITWCKPHGLTIERIKHLKSEFDRWCSIVGSLEQKEVSRAEGILL